MTRSVGDDKAQTITRLLIQWEAGDPAAFDRLTPLVYEELRTIAHRHRRRWTGDTTMGTTALVHEAYLKLAERAGPAYISRLHFLAVASRAMRQILIDYARSRRRIKRGGAAERVSLDTLEHVVEMFPPIDASREEEILRLDESLQRLEIESPRHCRIVECRFFGGMTIDETAKAMGVSAITVKRGWALAQAWLRRDLAPLQTK